MTRKLLVVTATLLTIFSLKAQAKSGDTPYQRLQLNMAQAASFESTSTDVGHLVVINGNEHIVQPKNTFDLAGQNLRFTPNDLGGYDVSMPEDVEFVEAFGDVLKLRDDDSKKIDIGFTFPFFGEEHTEMFVNSDGNLTFGKGDAAARPRDLQRFLGESPRIGVLYTDLNPFDPFNYGRATVEVKQASEQVTVTWFNIEAFSEFFFGGVATMQVVLFNTGVIDIVFDKSDVRTGVVGVSPGRLDNAFQVNLVDYSDDLPVEGTTGAVAEVFVDLPTVNLRNVARECYRTHTDDFDSLVLFTNFESNLDQVGILAFAINVQNDVLGIGNTNRGEIFPQFDHTAAYGSQGKLRSFLAMKNLKVWEDDPLENTFGPATSTLSVLAHEYGHSWAAFIDPPELLGRDDAHWSFFLHTGGSVMGGNDIQDNGDGTFTTLAPKDLYSPLDLYLMGLLKPEEVPPTFLVADPYDLDIPPPYDEQFILSSNELQYLGPLGDVSFRGEKKAVRVEDIITVNGVRIPDAESSQKDFRVAFILLAMGEEGPTPEEINKVEVVRRFWPPFFHRAVNNLATMVSTLDGSSEDVRLPSEDDAEDKFTFTLDLNRGLNIISPPLRPPTPLTARSFMEMVGSTVIIGTSDEGEFISWTIETPGAGFPIEGGRGYIVNTPKGGVVTFTGEPWRDSDSTQAAKTASAPSVNGTLWAFVVDGVLDGEGPIRNRDYRITVDNLRTGRRLTEGLAEAGGRFTLGYADLSRTPVVQVSDTLRLTLIDTASDEPIGKTDRIVTSDHIRKAYATLFLTSDNITPMDTQLLQNYPNPFNPETWIPYQLASDADVSIIIYNQSGERIRTISIGDQAAGSYLTKGRAGYWDGRNGRGELVSSGLYFYHLQASDFTDVKRMIILK